MCGGTSNLSNAKQIKSKAKQKQKQIYFFATSKKNEISRINAYHQNIFATAKKLKPPRTQQAIASNKQNDLYPRQFYQYLSQAAGCSS
jgi:hypothetical protein